MSNIQSDGYGMPTFPFVLPDPSLPEGWAINRRSHTEDGEHVWHVTDPSGRSLRWLEDEDGPEWAYRVPLLLSVALCRHNNF